MHKIPVLFSPGITFSLWRTRGSEKERPRAAQGHHHPKNKSRKQKLSADDVDFPFSRRPLTLISLASYLPPPPLPSPSLSPPLSSGGNTRTKNVMFSQRENITLRGEKAGWSLEIPPWAAVEVVEVVEGQRENVLGVFSVFRRCFMEAVAARRAAG